MLQQSSSSSVADDNEEKDRFLKQVEARDLIEFGMIPVRFNQIIDVLASLLSWRKGLVSLAIEKIKCKSFHVFHKVKVKIRNEKNFFLPTQFTLILPNSLVSVQ